MHLSSLVYLFFLFWNNCFSITIKHNMSICHSKLYLNRIISLSTTWTKKREKFEITLAFITDPDDASYQAASGCFLFFFFFELFNGVKTRKYWKGCTLKIYLQDAVRTVSWSEVSCGEGMVGLAIVDISSARKVKVAFTNLPELTNLSAKDLILHLGRRKEGTPV